MLRLSLFPLGLSLALFGASGCETFTSCEEDRSCALDDTHGGAGGASDASGTGHRGDGLGGDDSGGSAPAADVDGKDDTTTSTNPPSCEPGFEAAEGECVDIDECSLGLDTCSEEPLVACENTEGGYECAPCPEGYVGTGSELNGCLLVAPLVLETTPASGAGGVLAGTNLVIVFSEPMDSASTEEAFSSADPAFSNPTFAWNEAGTELTVTPSSPYAYLGVTSPTAPAGVVEYAISREALDRDGDALLTAFSGSFSPKKRVTHTLAFESTHSGTIRRTGSSPSYVYSYGGASIGGRFPDAERGLLSYSLASVPENAALESAEVTLQLALAPGSNVGGPSSLRHLSTLQVALSGASSSQLGQVYEAAGVELALPSTGASPSTVDVETTVAARLAAGSNSAARLQLRIDIQTADDLTLVGQAAPLVLVYLAD